MMMRPGFASECRSRLAPVRAVAALGAGMLRVVADGVTLITHEFNSDVDSWIVPMQERVAHYSGLSPTNTACYEITITQNGQGQYVSAATFLSGTNPLAAASGEILIKLNWSTLSGLGVLRCNVVADSVQTGHSRVERSLA